MDTVEYMQYQRRIDSIGSPAEFQGLQKILLREPESRDRDALAEMLYMVASARGYA